MYYVGVIETNMCSPLTGTRPVSAKQILGVVGSLTEKSPIIAMGSKAPALKYPCGATYFGRTIYVELQKQYGVLRQ
jgi:hypothetical protein